MENTLEPIINDLKTLFTRYFYSFEFNKTQLRVFTGRTFRLDRSL